CMASSACTSLLSKSPAWKVNSMPPRISRPGLSASWREREILADGKAGACAMRRGCRDSLKAAREEAAERNGLILAERAPRLESFARVEAQRGLERLRVAGFEAEALVAPRTRLGDDVAEEGAADALAARGRCGTHRFHFAVIGSKLLERAHAEQRAVFARRPDGDGRVAQRDRREDVAGVRRRDRPELRIMHFYEVLDVEAVEIIGMKSDRHARPFRFERKLAEA